MSKFLQLMFSCHQIPSRSFFYRGRQFPICARCTGLLIGFIVFIPLAFYIRPTVLFVILLLMPMIIDGSMQSKTAYESNNIMRLLTGILGGIGILLLIYLIVYSGYLHGKAFGKRFR